MHKYIELLIFVFVLGWVCSSAYGLFSDADSEQSLSLPFYSSKAHEMASPYDHITEDQIHVYSNKIVLDLENAQWAGFTDTNSMDPVLDANTNSIEIKPRSQQDIHIGDIISYESKEGLIVHRVIGINKDQPEWRFIVKGDNNPVEDPKMVNFSQIRGIAVVLIY